MFSQSEISVWDTQGLFIIVVAPLLSHSHTFSFINTAHIPNGVETRAKFNRATETSTDCTHERESSTVIPNQASAANWLMQIINNVSICCDLELHNYFWETFSTLAPAANYEIGMKRILDVRYCRRIGNWNKDVVCLGWEMASVPEVISILIIRRKLETQRAPYWAWREVNGLIQKEKQGNVLSSVCSQCKIWLTVFQPHWWWMRWRGISSSSEPTRLDFGRTG